MAKLSEYLTIGDAANCLGGRAERMAAWRRSGLMQAEFCRRHGVDPFAYLRDVLTRIAGTPISQLDQFLPDGRQVDRKAQHAAE